MTKLSKFKSLRAAQCSGALILLAVSNYAAAPPDPTNIPEPGPVGLLLLGGVALLIAKQIKRK